MKKSSHFQSQKILKKPTNFIDKTPQNLKKKEQKKAE